MYSTDGQFYSAYKAANLVKEAIEAGALVRPNTCELCGKSPIKRKSAPIHAHHWNGHNNPLDVWFICGSCNGYLIGERFHIGKVSREQATAYILARHAEKNRPSNHCKAINLDGRQCSRTILGYEYCGHHRKLR